MSRDPRGAKPKDPSGKTQLQLATEAGVSLATWKLWQGDLSLNGQELADRKKRAEIQRIEVETEYRKQLLANAKAEFHPKKETAEAIAQIEVVHSSYRAATESEFPSLFAGLDQPHEIETEVKKFNDEWDKKLKDSHDAVWEAARAAIQKMLRGDMKKVASKNKE